MNPLFDEVKLTAFALGQLQGEDAKEMAALIRENYAAKKFVEETSSLAQALKFEFTDHAKFEEMDSEKILAKAMREIKFRKNSTYFELTWQRSVGVFLFLLIAGFPFRASLLKNTELVWERIVSNSFKSGVEQGDTKLVRKQFPVDVNLPERPEAKALVGPFNFEREKKSGEEKENQFLSRKEHPRASFSIYSTPTDFEEVLSNLQTGLAPDSDDLLLDRLLNTFDFNYPSVEKELPFSVFAHLVENPWNPETKILRIALKARSGSGSEMVAKNVRTAVEFRSSVDFSYRLLGFDSYSNSGGSSGGPTYANRTHTALFEVQLPKKIEFAHDWISVIVAYEKEPEGSTNEYSRNFNPMSTKVHDSDQDFQFALGLLGSSLFMRSEGKNISYELIHSLLSKNLNLGLKESPKRRAFLDLLERSKSRAP